MNLVIPMKPSGFLKTLNNASIESCLCFADLPTVTFILSLEFLYSFHLELNFLQISAFPAAYLYLDQI